MSNPTFSEDYRLQQVRLHQTTNYGTASLGFGRLVTEVLRRTGAKSLSDYGAGKQNLLKALVEAGAPEFDYRPYDPAFPDYGPARQADLVCCIDVLEHIEPQFIDNVIAELAELTTGFGFFSIQTGPARKTLEDGRNAHLIQEPSSWWLRKLATYFDVLELRTSNTTGPGFWLLTQRIAPPAP